MEIAKFEMDNDLLPIKDATARQAAADVLVVAERAEGKADDAQTVAARAEGKADDAHAVADRAEGKADDALIGLESKQNISSALKIGKLNITETNVTIASLANYLFKAPIPDGQTDVVVLNARSSDATRTLIPVNLYTNNGYMNAIMSNQKSSPFTNETMTIEFIYAYK